MFLISYRAGDGDGGTGIVPDGQGVVPPLVDFEGFAEAAPLPREGVKQSVRGNQAEVHAGGPGSIGGLDGHGFVSVQKEVRIRGKGRLFADIHTELTGGPLNDQGIYLCICLHRTRVHHQTAKRKDAGQQQAKYFLQSDNVSPPFA